MSTFLVLTAIMLVAAVLMLVLPVLRTAKSAGDGESPHAWPVAILVVILVPIGAIEVYRSVSTWNWQMPEGPAHASGMAGADQAASLQEATRTLEERLRNEPGDVEGWVMLGRTYMVIGRFDDAAGALKKAVDLTGGEDPAILGQYAEALTVADQDRLVTETGPIFESLLEIDPADQRGLFYGGMYAYAQERYEVARERWETLQAMNPPESVRPIIDQRLLMVYEKLGVHPPGVVEKTPAMAAAEAAAQSPSNPSVRYLPRRSAILAPSNRRLARLPRSIRRIPTRRRARRNLDRENAEDCRSVVAG